MFNKYKWQYKRSIGSKTDGEIKNDESKNDESKTDGEIKNELKLNRFKVHTESFDETHVEIL